MDLENRNIMSYLCFCVELKQVLLLKVLESEFEFQLGGFQWLEKLWKSNSILKVWTQEWAGPG